jgi:hypothetical protein
METETDLWTELWGVAANELAWVAGSMAAMGLLWVLLHAVLLLLDCHTRYQEWRSTRGQ